MRDINNKDQLDVCIYWVTTDCIIHEDPIGLVTIPQPDPDALTAALEDAVLCRGLSTDDCRDQAYDGIQNMRGHLQVVETHIKQEVQAAIPVHCMAHCLNLVLQEAGESQTNL